MTVIELQIPDDLEPVLQHITGDKQQFIINAVRQQLSATDADIEAAASNDSSDETLLPSELAYYLSLPNVPSR